MLNAPHLHRYAESHAIILFCQTLIAKNTKNYISRNLFNTILTLQEGLKNVFDEAIIAAMNPPPPPKKSICTLI